ncbi:hypothetical protein YC2023_046519 [Brassica napus]
MEVPYNEASYASAAPLHYPSTSAPLPLQQLPLIPNPVALVKISESYTTVYFGLLIKLYNAKQPFDLETEFQEVNGFKRVYLYSAATSQKPTAVLEALQNYYEMLRTSFILEESMLRTSLSANGFSKPGCRP